MQVLSSEMENLITVPVWSGAGVSHAGVDDDVLPTLVDRIIAVMPRDVADPDADSIYARDLVLAVLKTR